MLAFQHDSPTAMSTPKFAIGVTNPHVVTQNATYADMQTLASVATSATHGHVHTASSSALYEHSYSTYGTSAASVTATQNLSADAQTSAYASGASASKSIRLGALSIPHEHTGGHQGMRQQQHTAGSVVVGQTTAVYASASKTRSITECIANVEERHHVTAAAAHSHSSQGHNSAHGGSLHDESMSSGAMVPPPAPPIDNTDSHANDSSVSHFSVRAYS